MSDKDKKPDSLPAPTDPGRADMGAHRPDLTAASWAEESHKKALKESVGGRAVIRAFSRGVMGVTGFALGGYFATKAMKHYSPEAEITFAKGKRIEGAIQSIARFFDKTFGRGLKKAAELTGKDGDRLVNNFRPSVHFPGYKEGVMGRSLGHEVTMVTFDFASMSIGDFWGRKIMHTLDPNRERPKWKREDGSIDWAQAAKTFGHNWWTAITYSAGEDWAVAVPYCLTMHHIGRPAVSKIVPGYQFDFDRNGNGGGLLIDDHGRITGNLTAGGVYNLWERFTTYNVGTLMFREAYNWTGTRIKHWWKTHEVPRLIEENPAHPKRTAPEAVADGASQFANWVARSTVKAVMYMIPAVPFFWVTRVPQHKFQGMFVHPEKGALMYVDKEVAQAIRSEADRAKRQALLFEKGTVLKANTPRGRYKDAQFFFSETAEGAIHPLLHPSNAVRQENGLIDHQARPRGFWDTVLYPVGRAADWVRGKLNRPISKAFALVDKGEALNMADTLINASMSYAPYFWAKSDWLADKWDHGRMDAALDRTLSGAVKLNGGEFMAGLDEVRRSLHGENSPKSKFKDPTREMYAQCRIETDDTPSDNKFNINPTLGGNCDFLIEGHASGPTPDREEAPLEEKRHWRERLVTGRPEDRPEIGADRPKSHAEREEMRELLKNLQPPTNSIN